MNVEDAFLVLPAIEPGDRPAGPTDDDDHYGYTELQEYLTKIHHYGMALKEVTDAGLQAWAVQSEVQYNQLPKQLQVKTIEAYATYVMTAVWLQASAEEWGCPTTWTDAAPDNDGYIAVYNDQPGDYQGPEVDYFRIDETGLTMKMMEF